LWGELEVVLKVGISTRKSEITYSLMVEVAGGQGKFSEVLLVVNTVANREAKRSGSTRNYKCRIASIV
jgi:hypothetical protein